MLKLRLRMATGVTLALIAFNTFDWGMQSSSVYLGLTRIQHADIAGVRDEEMC